MLAHDLREKYLRFFENKGHKRIPSAPLIPEHDPTVLFTTAGMHPLVPFLLGEKHALGARLCNSQKCIRTGDIDDVGDATHLTFFEMLGNWSLGDYFKKEAIEWSFEFLTKELGIPKEKLAFSVFEGDEENHILKDEEVADIWKSLGISEKRIAYLGRDDNWWGPAGLTGPCGPCTEMFYWTGKTPAPKDFNPSDKQWVEIWNDVFMQYNKTSDGSFEELSQKNVDTGMGLERVTAILQGKDNVYGTELFQSIIEEIKGITEKPYEENEKSFRIIADHLKAATFILAEKLVPFKDGRGYVLRKLIRRAIKYAWVLDINTTQFVPSLVPVVIDIYKDIYTELEDNKDFVINEMAKEINDFSNKYEESFKNSVKEYSRNLELFSAEKTEPFSYKQMFPRIKEISGKEIFKKYQERGGVEPEFIRMKVEENMAEEERKVNEHEWKKITDEFNEALLNHQNLSRTASAGQFKSGLADNSEQTTKYHTATHLLLAALREVLGDEVVQKGSNITAERIRFDFSFNRKVAAEEIKKVEDLVNEKIRASLPVVCEEMETEQAKERGAMGVFGHKYGDRVKVYSIGQGENICSQEICAGPHVQNTKELGEFKIIKEEASSAGIRRVKATLS